MKTVRLLAASLIAATALTLASAQQNQDLTALRAKAEKGNGLAQYNLGLAYAEGRGVPLDRLEAYVWLSLARENGARGAALDNLIASFDKGSLEMAQQRLADHKSAATGTIPSVATNSVATDPIPTIKTTVAAKVVAAASTAVETGSVAQQIAALTADKKQLSEEVAKAWKEIDALNAALGKAQQELRSASPKAATADLDKLAARTKELETSLSSADGQKKVLTENLASTLAELAEAKAALAEQTKKAEQLTAADAARLTPSAEMAATRNQLAATQAHTAALTDELAKVRASETSLHDTIAQLEQDKAQLVARPDLTNKVRELEAALGDSNQKLADASGQLKNAATTASRVTELEAQAATLQSSLAAAQAQVNTLQSAGAAKSTAPAYPDLSDKVRELEARLVAVNQQADSAVQTAVAASKQSVADLNAAGAQIARLKEQLATKSAAPATPDLSGRVRELETQLSDAAALATNARQEAASLAKARDEALKNRGPAYPNLAGRVVELQTALAESKRDLADAQNALHTAEQARAAAPAAPVAVAPESGTPPPEVTDLQKRLADTEDKLATALKGYALLQREHDAQAETNAKANEAVTNERNSLSTQVTALTAEVEQLKSGASGQVAAAQAETARVTESLAALQRSTAQNSTDLTAARALLHQLQGANTVLANENYQLKTKLTPGAALASAPTAPGATPSVTPSTPTPAPATPAAAQGAARTHVVAAGDTLFRISQRYYNTPNRWQEIYKANAAKLGTNGVLKVGSELTIP